MTKVSDYRNHLSKYHRKVIDDHDPLRISVSGKGDVIIIPAEDYENLQETIYILKDKLTMSSLIETRKDIYNKSFNGNSIEESFEDVMESKNKRSY